MSVGILAAKTLIALWVIAFFGSLLVNLKESEMKTYKALGLLLTFVWFIIVLATMGFSEFSALKLNEKGDFFAGVFAPIAFLWLVLGYLQQGRELSLNTEALKLQVIELKQQVEVSRDLARSAEIQANLAKRAFDHSIEQFKKIEFDRRRNLQPDFEFELIHQNGVECRVKATNHGGNAYQIGFGSTMATEGMRIEGDESGVRKGDSLEFTFLKADPSSNECYFSLFSEDADGRRYEFRYQLHQLTRKFHSVHPYLRAIPVDEPSS